MSAVTSSRNTLCYATLRYTTLLLTAKVFLSSPILVTLIMEAIHFFETSVLIGATRRNIPEDSILHKTTS
jgi:hypothetical protein